MARVVHLRQRVGFGIVLAVGERAMKIYISGPISGHEDLNLPDFRSAATGLEGLGHKPVVPHDILPWVHDGECPPSYTRDDHHTAACYLRGDMVELLQCDGILMLLGWEASVGARLEHSVASHCGIPIYYMIPEGAGFYPILEPSL